VIPAQSGFRGGTPASGVSGRTQMVRLVCRGGPMGGGGEPRLCQPGWGQLEGAECCRARHWDR